MPIAEPQPVPRIGPVARFRAGDAALVRAMQAGDEEAFAAIFKRHHAPLLAYCRHMLGNHDEGEDALQQAFIKAHQALLGGTAPRELRPWLYAIARNCCLSTIAARRGWVGIESLEDRTPALAGLSEEVHQREDLRELLAGIGRLPEDQRSALLLAELDDLSHQAIATIVGCPVSKVKALVYQARSALIADRDARNAPCQDIREQLSVAHGGELRRGPLRRHLKLCVGCRDFQLALSAQHQSLAVVLPVLPSAGLAAAILGHGAAHTAGAASIGGAGAGLAPAGGAGAGVTATGGTGIAASGTTAAATTAVGAGSSTSVGALIGGGLITKLAVGGTVVALAAAGAVAVPHHRPTHAIPHRATRLLANLRSVAPSDTAARRSVATEIASSSGPSSSLGPESPPALASAAGPAGSTGAGSAAEGLGGPAPLPTTTGTPPPRVGGIRMGGIPGQPAGKAGYRRAARRRHHLRRARHRRHLRAAHRRARLRKALRHHRRLAMPQPPKPPVAPAPVRAPHRKARLTPTSGTTVGSQTGTSTTGSAHHGANGGHHHPPTSTGSTGTGEGTGTAGTGTGKTGSGTGAGKTGEGGSGKAGGGKAKSKNTEKPSNSSESATNETGSSSEPTGTATGTSETTGTGTTRSPGTKAHPKKHLVAEEQLPNF
jgi:RNA polymerase sigma factor (sigma-70 family)